MARGGVELPTFRFSGMRMAKDGEWYVARCLEVEVASQGETIDEALANLREALELYLLSAVGSALPRSRVARRPLERVVGHLLPARLDTGEV